MAKKSRKRPDPAVAKLTTTIKKLEARLDKAESATAEWKAKAKKWKTEAKQSRSDVRRLETTAARTAEKLNELKKLKKLAARDKGGALQEARRSEQQGVEPPHPTAPSTSATRPATQGK